MYLIPQKHRCPKCGFECSYGPHDPFPAPVLSEGPVCPQCYANFLRQHCGVMQRGDAPDKEGLPGAVVQSYFS
jgi:hypothetical protein